MDNISNHSSIPSVAVYTKSIKAAGKNDAIEKITNEEPDIHHGISSLELATGEKYEIRFVADKEQAGAASPAGRFEVKRKNANFFKAIGDFFRHRKWSFFAPSYAARFATALNSAWAARVEVADSAPPPSSPAENRHQSGNAGTGANLPGAIHPADVPANVKQKADELMPKVVDSATTDSRGSPAKPALTPAQPANRVGLAAAKRKSTSQKLGPSMKMHHVKKYPGRYELRTAEAVTLEQAKAYLSKHANKIVQLAQKDSVVCAVVFEIAPGSPSVGTDNFTVTYTPKYKRIMLCEQQLTVTNFDRIEARLHFAEGVRDSLLEIYTALQTVRDKRNSSQADDENVQSMQKMFSDRVDDLKQSLQANYKAGVADEALKNALSSWDKEKLANIFSLLVAGSRDELLKDREERLFNALEQVERLYKQVDNSIRPIGELHRRRNKQFLQKQAEVDLQGGGQAGCADAAFTCKFDSYYKLSKDLTAVQHEAFAIEMAANLNEVAEQLESKMLAAA